MSTGHTARNYLLSNENQVVAASQTEQVVSEEFVLYAEDARSLVVDIHH